MANLTPEAAVSALRSPTAERLHAAAAHHGAAGLLPLLAGEGSREATVAAITAAPGADDAHLLLASLAALAAGPDRSLAAPAARAAATIAEVFDRDRAMLLDVSADEIRAAIVAWRSLGAARDRWADVRVHALEITTRLRDALGAEADDGDAPYDFDALVADDDPEVRRAALELLPQPIPARHIAATARRLSADPDPVVAVVAAQVLCAGLAFDDDPDPILGAIDAAAMDRLRALVADQAMPPGARADAARCLADSP